MSTDTQFPAKPPVDNYFGGCPHCGKTDGYTNVGKSHWFFCKAHRTTWFGGSNEINSWRKENLEDQRRAYDAIGLDEFTEVEPLPCTNPEFVRKVKPLANDDVPTSDRAGRTPTSKEATMNRPIASPVPPTEEPNMEEMDQEVCEFAHALLRRGGSPLLVVQALIAGTMKFAGRIGEEAMRQYISDVDQIG